ncbi:LLM class F420-dependent oxidoreductase [Actinomadura sp. 7K534]|uniref:LLM class F420-dependent oxidoreductase n=1 Tax=Actinomadura sp. 7K534 TaxID=2530366 RepID=UPI00104EE801|nr:LLM class F420-dependent oxidoreductase [Actinomadura sp. 7K534]TDB95457.1 LLM class F420-dependent oxidoreductase [Actinomadura sp. 7K534]
MLRFGIQLPHYGGPLEFGLDALVDAVADAGFDGIWVSDHVVLVDGTGSRYPYTDDGGYGFPPDTPWYEAIATLAYLAARTRDVELGAAVCVLPQRQPVLLAKQLATIDRLAGGRLRLGAGAGWLAEEFTALGVPYDGRGARTDAAIALLRACWTGEPPPGRYGDVSMPRGVHCRPTPVNGTVPIFVGGNSPAALRRAARLGDGWLGAVPLAGLPVDELGAMVARLRRECLRAGRDPAALELGLRIAAPSGALGTPELRDLLTGYASHGVTRFTVDLSWRDLDTGRRRLDALSLTAAAVRKGLTVGAS